MSIKKISVVCRLIRNTWEADFSVLADDDGSPQGGAVITVGTVKLTTATNGTAVLTGLTAGTYSFSIALAGFEPFASTFTAA